MKGKTVYLIDGTFFCYRSFYSIRLTTAKGFPTGAVYGFYNILRKVIKKFEPEYMVVCFDVSRKTFRREKFKEYTSQRPPAPEGLTQQIPLIQKMIKGLGIVMAEKEGYEADDVIASLTEKSLQENARVVIMSSDKDLLQLLYKDSVCVYDPVKEKRYGEEEFRKENGFAPAQLVDFLALAGDASDNIPGAKGIGKVGAAKLVKE